MAKKSSMKDKLFLATYDKPQINKSVLGLKKSLDEVSLILNGKSNGKKK